jgi:hypothetical protein
MKTLFRFAAILLATAALFLSGCTDNSSADKVTDELGAQLDKIPTLLTSIKDKATAEKAMAELKQIGEEIKKLGERAKSIKVTNEKKTEIQTKLAGKTAEFQTKMTAAAQSLATAGPEAAVVVQKGMAEFGQSMQEFAKAMAASGN